MKASVFPLLLAAVALALGGCGQRTIRVDLVPVQDRLTPQVIEEGDAGLFTSNEIAMINVTGLISNGKPKSLLSNGTNPVSDFRETLDAIARDDSVKAVVLRINSPGGTVTASDMMYRDLLAFKKKTNKPVVTCMMDICASGGYYLSCGSDYRIAYPTTITGSIGVIMETMNLHGTLSKLGIQAEAVKSAQNKDMGSPFKPPASPDHPLDPNDRELLQAMIDQYYAGFKAIVKASPQHISDADWAMVTDGRVFSGKDAARLGLIDETGDLDVAIHKAEDMAHIHKARIIEYTHQDDTKGSIYAANPGHQNTQPQMNLFNLDVDLGDMIPHGQSQFLYMWPGFDLSDSE